MWKEERKKNRIADEVNDRIVVISTLTDNRQLDGLLDLSDNVEIVNTNDYKINHCVGCNHCWIQTPGKCCQSDDYEIIYQKILKANKIIFASEEKLGFVSYQLKNIVDRLISLDLPYTCIVNGQTRHAARYNKCWKFLMVCPKGEQISYLNEWLNRMAINFHSQSLGVYKLTDSEAIKRALCNH